MTEIKKEMEEEFKELIVRTIFETAGKFLPNEKIPENFSEITFLPNTKVAEVVTFTITSWWSRAKDILLKRYAEMMGGEK